MAMTGLEHDTAAAYRNFGQREAHGHSPLYERLCLEISADQELLALINGLTSGRRQPNLVLAATRFLGAPMPPIRNADDADAAHAYRAWRTWTVAHWHTDVVPAVLTHATQTNEPGRCAALLPFLGEVERPMALVEVGCSAGLTLLPDRYSYRYSGAVSGALGTSEPTLTCQVSGDVRVPKRLPDVRFRAGVDLNPLDVGQDADRRWLRALIWPGQTEREERFDHAVAQMMTVKTTKAAPQLHAGDLVDDLAALLERVPETLHLVIFHTAVLAYADEAKRCAFAERMRQLRDRPGGFTWIANEAPSVDAPSAGWAVQTQLQADPGEAGRTSGKFVISVDGHVRALAAPHGQELVGLPRHPRSARHDLSH